MKHIKLFEEFINEAVELVHVYDTDGSMYGTGELVKTKGKKSLVRWDGSREEWYPSELVKLVESSIDEAKAVNPKQKGIGKFLGSVNNTDVYTYNRFPVVLASSSEFKDLSLEDIKAMQTLVYDELKGMHQTKLTVSELKAKIKEQILSTLTEADEDIDVDIDVEDEVEVEAGADDIEIEKKGTDIKVEVGLSPEEELIQDSLKAAMDAADSLGNQKLADQIGNTITFFTREYVVGNRD